MGMWWKLELKSFPEQRNAFIKITLSTSLLKLGQQCTSKVVLGVSSIRMGWKSELKSLPVQRNGFIEITLLTSLLKSDCQCICKTVK